MSDGKSAEVEILAPWNGKRSLKEGSNTRDAYRGTLGGKLLNLGTPISTFQNLLNNEIYNQFSKDNNSLPYELRVIPGFEYNKWSLSDVMGASSFYIGLADGYFDKKEAKESVENDYQRIVDDGAVLAAIGKAGADSQKYIDEQFKARFGDAAAKEDKGGKGDKGGYTKVKIPGAYKKCLNDFEDSIEWERGAHARYLFEVDGAVKNARVKRMHMD